MPCPACRREVPPDSMYCSWCGTRLAETAPAGQAVMPVTVTPAFAQGWRSATGGWVILHVGLGLAVGFAEVLLVAAITAAVGRSVEPTLAVALMAPVTLILSAAGWLLFVYVQASPAARSAAFVSMGTAGFAMLLVTALATQPAT
jgi:hypothetical protein